jgi:hypothetical protein
MKIGENKRGPGTGSFVEEGGKPASMANKTSKGVKLFGLDLAAGGLGRRDFNGDVILPDGAHGHMFIGFTKPTKKTDGALQIGLETTGPGVDGLVGNKHNWLSTEATANPESSFFGHKMQKIGGGGLKVNQRLVDLNKVQTDAGQKWLAVLDDSPPIWTPRSRSRPIRSAGCTRASPVRARRRSRGPPRSVRAKVLRDALMRHPSRRRRTHAVPVALGDSGQVLTWLDVFG